MFSGERLPIPDDDRGRNKDDEENRQALGALQVVGGMEIPPSIRRRSGPRHPSSDEKISETLSFLFRILLLSQMDSE